MKNSADLGARVHIKKEITSNLVFFNNKLAIHRIVTVY